MNTMGTKVFLSDNQKAKMKTAFNKGESVSIRIDKTKSPNTTVTLNQTQLNKLKIPGKTCDLTFSKTQIGGFLPFLIPAAIAAGKALGVGGLSYLGSQAVKKLSGNGLKIPGKSGNGLKIPRGIPRK